MPKVAIHGRLISPDSLEPVKKLLAMLHEAGKDIYVSPTLDRLNSEHLSFKRYPQYTLQEIEGFEFIISLGGDGTLLETLTHVGEAEVPTFKEP